jgi:hypothetical protein
VNDSHQTLDVLSSAVKTQFEIVITVQGIDSLQEMSRELFEKIQKEIFIPAAEVNKTPESSSGVIELV